MKLAVFVVATFFAVSSALAQNYVTDATTEHAHAVILKQSNPSYPDGNIRSGQEGWVRLNFIVSSNGRAIEPIVVDSVGGILFEKSAIDALDDWRFEPVASGDEVPHNRIDMRFELYRGRDAATSNFLRRYRRIMTHVSHEETEKARGQVDQATELGGWNLYESTMLALMVGRVEGQEGDLTEKLENYLRALNIGNRNALDGKNRRDVLSRIFDIQYEHAQYGAAVKTFAMLKSEPGSQSAVEALQTKADEIVATLADNAAFAARATIYSPCNCEMGVPLWSYTPARRQFSFAGLDGNVERFEARCHSGRLGGAVETERRWKLPDEWGACEIFVFGDDGARFEFVEHGGSERREEHAEKLTSAPGAMTEELSGYREE